MMTRERLAELLQRTIEFGEAIEVVHVRTGNRYTIEGPRLGRALGGPWCDGVGYERDGEGYWRCCEDFAQSFSEVETP